MITTINTKSQYDLLIELAKRLLNDTKTKKLRNSRKEKIKKINNEKNC